MTIPNYLALNAEESAKIGPIFCPIARTGCHFSETAALLVGVPASLPPQSLLVVDDSTPFGPCDVRTITQQLHQAAQTMELCAIVLDFQRPPTDDALQLVCALSALPCPVFAPPAYAQTASLGIFVPPIPLPSSAEKFLHPWKGRKLLLELAPDTKTVIVTKDGSAIRDGCAQTPLYCRELCLHYGVQVFADRAEFSLRRTSADALAFLAQLGKYDVAGGVGLWYEFYAETQKPPV